MDCDASTRLLLEHTRLNWRMETMAEGEKQKRADDGDTEVAVDDLHCWTCLGSLMSNNHFAKTPQPIQSAILAMSDSF